MVCKSCGKLQDLVFYAESSEVLKVKAGTKAGQYLRRRPFLALALLLFSAMAALPVGLFLLFALITIVMSVVGFVFFEVFLLFVGGMTLLSVLSGIALFSLVVSIISSDQMRQAVNFSAGTHTPCSGKLSLHITLNVLSPWRNMLQ
uniref:Transmembrane protein 159 n=1 Tax=Poecilia latipinna TaxID=48699 RepID=A0A3B3UHZ1_9TELE